MSIFTEAQTDAGDLAKLVNENTEVTTRYGGQPKKSWLKLQAEFEALISYLDISGNYQVDQVVSSLEDRGSSQLNTFLSALDSEGNSRLDAILDDIASSGSSAIDAFAAASVSAIDSFNNSGSSAINSFNTAGNTAIEFLKTSQGFYDVGTFASGFVYGKFNDVGRDDDGNPWVYIGDESNYPVTVAAGTDPTAFPLLYAQRGYDDHAALANRTSGDAHPSSSITNDDTLTSQDTHDATKSLLIAQGLSGNFGFFEKGFDYIEGGDVAVYNDGSMWLYNGALPKSVTAADLPSEPLYSKVSIYNSGSFDSVEKAVLFKNHKIGDSVRVNNYYGSSSQTKSGVLFFTVVNAGANIEDGGKYIDLDNGLQLEQNLKIPCDPKAWGATADGATLDKDTNALNNALNYAGSMSVSAGTYMVDAVTNKGIFITSNQKIVGEGDAILKVIPNDQKNHSILYLSDDSENIYIENLKIVGDRDDHIGTIGEAGHGIQIRHGVKNVYINKVEVREMWGDGLYMGGGDRLTPASNVNVYNSVFDYNRRQGSSLTCATDINYYSCKFLNTIGTLPECGVDLETNTVGSVGQVVSHVNFVNCEFSGNNNSGLNIDANESDGLGELVHHISFSKCIFKDNASRGALLLGGGDHIDFSGCDFPDNGGYGLGIFNSSGKNSNITISGSILEGNGRANLFVDREVENLRVHGNTFGVVDRDTDYTAYMRDCTDAKIHSNTFKGSLQGLRLSACINSSVTRNTFHGIPYVAVEISDSGTLDNIVDDNKFISCATMDPSTTFENYTGTPVLFRNVSVGNIAKGNYFIGENKPFSGYYTVKDTGTTLNRIYDDYYKWTDIDIIVKISSSGNNTYTLIGELITPVYSDTALVDGSRDINTIRKTRGKMVFNSSQNLPFWATGDQPNDAWTSADGTLLITPV